MEEKTAAWKTILLVCLLIVSGAGLFSFIKADSLPDVGGEADGRSYSATAADYNNDGHMDIYVVNYLDANTLYLNNGDGTFTETAESAGVADIGKGISSAWADYDLDGDEDLYLVNTMGDMNRLFRNEGDGTFKDMTLNSGMEWTVHKGGADAAWADYDLDGDPDLLVAQNGHLFHLAGLSNILYRNNGDGTFTDVTETAGLVHYGAAISVAWADYDLDGYPDLYVTNFTNLNLGAPENTTNTLYRNQGDGTFEDVTVSSGTYDYQGGYQVAWGDYDNDGLADLYVANLLDILPSSVNSLFKNNGDGTFSEAGAEAGIDAADSSVGAVWADFDLDGRIDLLVTNYLAEADSNSGFLYQIFMNNGDGTFTERADAFGLTDAEQGNKPAVADYNNDGFPDIFMPRVGYENSLYLNREGTAFEKSTVKVIRKLSRARTDSAPKRVTAESRKDTCLLAADIVNSHIVTVSWDFPADVSADAYYVYFSKTSDLEDFQSPSAVADAGTSGWTVEGLDSDTSYHVRVFPVVGDRILQYPEVISVRTLPASFEENVRTVFAYGCDFIECHNPINNQYDLTLTENTVPSDIVGVTSRQNSGMNLIEAYDSNNSYLFHKLNDTQLDAGGFGSRMPYSRIDPLRDEELSAIEEWITLGAKSLGLGIYTDREFYGPAGSVEGTVNIFGSTEEAVDLYIVLTAPDGTAYYVTDADSGSGLTPDQTPFQGDWTLADVQTTLGFSLSAENFNAYGVYTLSASVVSAGGTGLDAEDLIANTSTVEFERLDPADLD